MANLDMETKAIAMYEQNNSNFANVQDTMAGDTCTEMESTTLQDVNTKVIHQPAVSHIAAMHGGPSMASQSCIMYGGHPHFF
jgi:hypothetical protein